MLDSIKKNLKPLLPNFIKKRLRKRNEEFQYTKWVESGKPLPPPHIVKQKAIHEYRKKMQIKILVETGTYLGDMVEAMKNDFKKILSIELSQELYEKAQQRFKDDKRIEIWQGDSGKIMPQIVAKLDCQAIFWLDGHYSSGITAKGEKDCPIFEELDAILAHKEFNHVLLIDDARCFVGQGDYPTVSELKKFVDLKCPGYSLEVKDDLIRFVK